MSNLSLTRRSFVGALTAAGFVRGADGDWVELFNGRNLDGWRASENAASWKVIDGQLAADGPRSHLFYTGPLKGASFKNFELEVEAMARPLCNSGVYFHTAFQEKGWPSKGFEVQINNTAKGEGGYLERKKTGSLYGPRNIYKQLVADNAWFKMNVLVRGNNVQVRVNGTLLVDYYEPDIQIGTFALQCHDAGSKALFKSIRVRPLPDSIAFGEAPNVDAIDREILSLGKRNFPVVDYHVHLKGTLTLEQVLAKTRRDGIQVGLAVNCGKGFPVQDDASARAFIQTLKGQPVFIAMQAEGREWVDMFSRETMRLFDYVFTDSMTWSDNNGKRMRTWIPEEVGTITDPQAFMEMLVDRTVGILEREPIDIYVNPTYIPDSIGKDYDRLWTEKRMKRVIDAAVKNRIAIEINCRRNLPSPTFLKMAKAAGCKFSFGTNNGGAEDLGRCEYGIQMVKECKLTWQDFFVPGWRQS